MATTLNFGLYKRLLRYIFPYKLAIAATVLTLVGLAALEPYKAVLMEKLFDDGLIEKNQSVFLFIPLAIAGLFIAIGLVEYVSKVTSQWIAQKAILNIRADMFAKLHRLPLSTHQAYGTGKLMSKITYDVPMASNALSNGWVILIRDTLILIALLGYLAFQSWQLTLILLVAGPLLAFILERASKIMRRSSKAMQKNMGSITQQLEESLRAHRDIKIYGAESYENLQFHKTAEKLLKHSLKVTKVSALNVPLVQVIAAVALSVIIYIAMLMVNDGLLSPGELLSYIVAMAMTFEPIRRLTNVNVTIQKGMAAAESIFELLDQAEEVDQGSEILPQENLTIEFSDAGFHYNNAEEAAISQLNLIVESNQTTALVGQSGSGKTTLAHLMTGFYPLSSGKLTIAGIPIEAVSLKSLRHNIAFVSQDINLFDDTIAANIAYGHDTYDYQDIKQAAINAHAWEFIEKLPQGLETSVGDSGCNLSGGQRQRISLARAFLKNAPILILDEATSALDNQSEQEIQKAMEEMQGKRTIIIIAHRLSSIKHADKIVVLENGKVVEEGDHNHLMLSKGHYTKLHQIH